MAAIVPRTSDWKSTYALVVISPAMTTRPVAVRVSQATRLYGSCARQASRIASEIWSAILSGCPSVTDSLVNRKRSRLAKTTPPQSQRVPIQPLGLGQDCIPSFYAPVSQLRKDQHPPAPISYSTVES